MNQTMRNHLKSGLHHMFVLGQSIGLDVLPHHFYSNIPNLTRLRRTNTWKQPSTMTGVAGISIESQLHFLHLCCTEETRERLNRGDIYENACRRNGAEGYGRIEADLLFCFIYTKQPKKIIQLGAGVSTAVILDAAQQAGYRPDILCVDPFPTRYLLEIAQKGQITLLSREAQEVRIDALTDVQGGDMLFVDSTHAVRAGSEVNRVILEVLPRLPSGCFVHFHDIYFPYDYPSSLFSSLFFGGESTLLHAFLINNSRYAVAASLSMLHHARPEQLKSIFPHYRPASMEYGLHTKVDRDRHFPSATYLLSRDGATDAIHRA